MEKANTLGDLLGIAQEQGANPAEVTVEFSDGMTMEGAHLYSQTMDGKTVWEIIVTDELDEASDNETEPLPASAVNVGLETAAQALAAAGGRCVEAFVVDGQTHYEVKVADAAFGPMVEAELVWFCYGLKALRGK